MSDRIDAAMTALRDADPVPDAEGFRQHMAEAAVLLSEIRAEIGTEGQPTGTMAGPAPASQVIGGSYGRSVLGGSGPTRQIPGLVVAALLVVAAVGIAAVSALLIGGGEASVTDAPPATVPAGGALGVAEAFMAAWVAGDGEAVAAMFSADGTFQGAIHPNRLAALQSWREAVGWEFQDHGCLAEAAADVEAVVCDFTSEIDLGRALDWPPASDSFRIIVGGASIEHAIEGSGFDAYSDLLFMFKRWVAANHPDDLERMFLHPTNRVSRVGPILDGEVYVAINAYPLFDGTSIALWDRYVDEFTSSPEAVARATEELAVARYITEAYAICLTAETEFEAEVAGLASGGQYSVSIYQSFPDLQSLAAWHDTRALYADAVIAQLHSLTVPDEIADRVERFLLAMEEENDLIRQVAAAAAAGDQVAVDALAPQRVDATGRRWDTSLGAASSECPVWSGGTYH